MFQYTDPAGTGVLAAQNALLNYQIELHGLYRQFAELPNSGFTMLEAFEALTGGAQATTAVVTWIAFPRTAQASFEEIDADRLAHQDEYVEWQVEQDPADGRLTTVTFTTQFLEYYEALAAAGEAALVAGIQDAYPAAQPTTIELFGTGFNPAQAQPGARAARFRNRAPQNPWNNGTKGILCLTQQFNTLHALLNLLGHCGVARPSLAPSAVCSNVGGACGPGRNSDPKVCLAAQEATLDRLVFSLADPGGIEILKLGGIWKLNGQQFDINDPANNHGLWRITHGGRRATLEIPPDLTRGDDPVTTGAEVAAALTVGAKVILASENDVPTWARTGHESSRMLPS